MKLNHKAIYKKIAEKYNIIYWLEINTPKNYTCFWMNEKDWNNKEPSFIIEKIPAWKYLKTLYIMKIKDSPLIDTIINDIEKEYEQAREWQSTEWCMDFNYRKDTILF